MLMQAVYPSDAEVTDIALPAGFSAAAKILAMGSELKSSFCLLEQDQAQLSHPRGDLEQVETYRAYREQLTQYCRKSGFVPERIAVDMHPDYLSTQLGNRLAEQFGAKLVRVQHHHAHIAACLAEHGHGLDDGPVLGIALDGLGYGADGSLWGGEFLLADYTGFRRLGCFQPVAMPGGAQSAREPWRNLFAQLQAAGWEQLGKRFAHLEPLRHLHAKPLPLLQAMLAQGVNSPPASSAGRLFDAVAAGLGIHRDRIAHEGQAAIELERIATSAMAVTGGAYPFALDASVDALLRIRWAPMWPALLTDLEQGMDPAEIAARFHHTVIEAVVGLAQRMCHQHDLGCVTLSGGVFQNRLLRHGVATILCDHGLDVLVPQRIPAHDGGLALGQAAIAAAKWIEGRR